MFTIIHSIYHGIKTEATTPQGAGYTGLEIGFGRCLLVYVSCVDIEAAVNKIHEAKQVQWHDANVNANLAQADNQLALNQCMYIPSIFYVYILSILRVSFRSS